jgi:hypothetical protein
MARFAPALALLLLSACGNALEIPEDIPITRLPADEDFVLTLVMESCSDVCARYDEPECDVSVDERENIITVDARVPFDANAVENCISICGGPILAHCEIDALSAGVYTVRSKGFEHEIILE